MSTRRGRAWVDPCAAPQPLAAVAAPYLAILVNNIQVYGTAADKAPPSFIVRALVDNGCVCYLKQAEKWAEFVPAGKETAEHLPFAIRVRGNRGQYSGPVEVRAHTVGLFYANAYKTAPRTEVLSKCATLSLLANATSQNLDALREAAAIIYSDPALTEQIDRAESDRLSGKATVKLQNASGLPVEIARFGTGAQSHLLDFLEVWNNTMEELNQITGRASVGEKTERRINAEMTVIENAAMSAIDVIIDTGNAWAKYNDIDIHFVRGHSLTYSPSGGEAEEGKGDNGTDTELPKPSAGTGTE